MALIGLLLAASLSAQPSRLVLGQDAGAELVVDAPAHAVVALSTSVGGISEPRYDGDLWRARFTPPSRRAPAVALILAVLEQGGSRELLWLALPMSGSDTMEIETKPGAKVVADVAGSTIGPLVADARGRLRLPMVVPPGVKFGTLHITDKLGNQNEMPLDLQPPPFTRLRIAPRREWVAAGDSLELEIFAVRPDGSPEERAPGVEAAEGEIEIERRLEAGTWLARFTAPAQGADVVIIDAKSAGQRASLEVPIRSASGQPAWMARTWQRPWTVSGGLIAGGGGTYEGAGAGSLLIDAAVRIRSLPIEAVLEGGGSAFTPLTQGFAQTETNAHSRSWMLQAGVRAVTELVRGLDGHAAILAGAQRQRITLVGAGATSSWSWTPRVAFTMGAGLRLGPGRALAQLQFDGSESGVAGLAGSLGGVQLQLGYLVVLR